MREVEQSRRGMGMNTCAEEQREANGVRY